MKQKKPNKKKHDTCKTKIQQDFLINKKQKQNKATTKKRTQNLCLTN